MKPGPVKADAPKVVLPDREAMKQHMDALIHHFLIVAEGFDVPAGEVYHPIEASKGELGVYMKSDGGPKPARVHFRGPSFVNLSALPQMSRRRDDRGHRGDHRIAGYRSGRDRSVSFEFQVSGFKLRSANLNT